MILKSRISVSVADMWLLIHPVSLILGRRIHAGFELFWSQTIRGFVACLINYSQGCKFEHGAPLISWVTMTDPVVGAWVTCPLAVGIAVTSCECEHKIGCFGA